MKTIYKILLLALIFTYSCKKDTVTPEEIVTPENLIKIGETYIIGAKTKALIYSAKPFETGYNTFFVALYDSVDGSKLSDGHFDVLPMMNMGMMQHRSPVEESEYIAETGFFKVAVVFSMPGNSTQWFLNLNFHNHKNDLEGKGMIGIDVIDSSPAKFLSTVMPLDSNASVLISLIQPVKAQVGINDFEIVIHKKNTMMEFPPINDYSVEIVPEMPSMGHGSPNNANPVLTSNGHYLGKVNFTMTGLWRINLKFYKNGILISSDKYFEITLP